MSAPRHTRWTLVLLDRPAQGEPDAAFKARFALKLGDEVVKAMNASRARKGLPPLKD